MSTLSLASHNLASHNDNVRFADGADIVGSHLASRRVQRQLVTFAAALAALVLVATLYHGYETLRPLPDQTFAYRV